MNYYELNHILLHFANLYTPFIIPLRSYLNHTNSYHHNLIEDATLQALQDPYLVLPFINPLFSFPAPSKDNPALFFSEFFLSESYTLHHFSSKQTQLRSIAPHFLNDLHYPYFPTNFFFSHFIPSNLQPY